MNATAIAWQQANLGIISSDDDAFEIAVWDKQLVPISTNDARRLLGMSHEKGTWKR